MRKNTFKKIILFVKWNAILLWKSSFVKNSTVQIGIRIQLVCKWNVANFYTNKFHLQLSIINYYKWIECCKLWFLNCMKPKSGTNKNWNVMDRNHKIIKILIIICHFLIYNGRKTSQLKWPGNDKPSKNINTKINNVQKNKINSRYNPNVSIVHSQKQNLKIH